MQYRSRVPLVFIALAVALMSPLSVSAQATTTTTTEKFTFGENFPNPCTGEVVLFPASEYTVTTSVTIDDTTGTHVTEQATISRKGFGLSTGDEYVSHV